MQFEDPPAHRLRHISIPRLDRIFCTSRSNDDIISFALSLRHGSELIIRTFLLPSIFPSSPDSEALCSLDM